ncbi:uncharacterized protein METZ01_LOCUS34046 [marine metagenome]|uniref:Uncharacterized protein n=1 Tax=marine metagenome TaxID=408172 RepID=A0A381QPC4_9ZZZZ
MTYVEPGNGVARLVWSQYLHLSLARDVQYNWPLVKGVIRRRLLPR